MLYIRVYRLRHKHFFDLASLTQVIREKVKEHNQTRRQHKPYRRRERFYPRKSTCWVPCLSSLLNSSITES